MRSWIAILVRGDAIRIRENPRHRIPGLVWGVGYGTGLFVEPVSVATLYDETGYTCCFAPEGASPICRTVAVEHPVPL